MLLSDLDDYRFLTGSPQTHCPNFVEDSQTSDGDDMDETDLVDEKKMERYRRENQDRKDH